MTAAKPIRATFAGYRPVPSRSVGALTFEVPLEELDAAVAALGGTPLPSRSAWVAIVRLGDDRPAAGAAHREDAGATPSLDPPAAEPHPLVKRAGILAKDPAFQRWAACSTDYAAAAFIRTQCQIASRRDLATDEAAAERFRAMDVGFRADTRADQYSPHLTGRK